MRPTDLGLPAHFTAFRTGQLDLAVDLASYDQRTQMVSAPTGAGKSLIAVATAKLVGGRALFLTHTKGLQGQFLTDFSSIGLSDMRGQQNYPCQPLRAQGDRYATCADGPDGSCPHRRRDAIDCRCPYLAAEAQARASELVVTNYSYWLSISRTKPDAIGAFDLLVLDEAHSAPDALAEFCAVTIDRDDAARYADVRPPDGDDLEEWEVWAKSAVDALGERAGADRTNRTLARLAQAVYRLSRLSDFTETEWVVDTLHREITFAPVWAQPYAESALFRRTPHVLALSATLLPDDGKYLGVVADQSRFVEVGSSFAPRRRPLIYVPTARCDHRMGEGELRQIVGRVDRIIDGRLDRKGIIHTRSYARAADIVRRSKFASIMLHHTSRTARETIARFQSAKPPCVLVSPSVEEGFDFAGDQCRYQILVKVPFPNTTSKVVARRCQLDKAYRNHLTARAIVQMVGRGMRSEQDWCESFVVDDHWAWFRGAAKWPKWFRSSWQQTNQVPEAMEEPR